jgi:hypothetical protein
VKRPELSYEARTGIAISLIMVFLIALIWVIMWAIATQSADSESCELQGGHIYSRTVGKMHYHKCVTDDDEVIRL